MKLIQVQNLIITELRGSYPNLKLPDDIDMEGLKSDLGFEPKPIILPIAIVNGRSRNGRTYSEQAVKDIVDAVNSDRLEGAWGHLRDEDRPHKYVPPSIRWVYAELREKGIAYGLGIPLDKETDTYFRAAARLNAKVGTSVYGTGTAKDSIVTEFKGAEKIDIADPMRVGIPETAAIPQLKEMKKEDDMTIELKDVPEAVRLQIIEQNSNSQNSGRISEMETQITGLQTQITELTGERDAARGEASTLLAGYGKAQIAEAVQLEPVRRLVERMVGIQEIDDGATIDGVSTVAELNDAIKAVLDDEDMKKFNKDSLKEMMGPDWKPPANGQKNNQDDGVLGPVIPS